MKKIKELLFGSEECNGIFIVLYRAMKRTCMRCGNKKDIWWCLCCRPCTKDSIELMALCDKMQEDLEIISKRYGRKEID